MSTCANCGKLIPEPNTAYGINPQALCTCCAHDRRPQWEPQQKISYLRSRCGSLIRDTGADDLVKHEARCPACLEGWSVYDSPESEERVLDDPVHVPYSQQRKP